MNANTLTPDLLHKVDAYRRVANYLSVDRIYLYDHPLLKRPPPLVDVRHMLLGPQGAEGSTVRAGGCAAAGRG